MDFYCFLQGAWYDRTKPAAQVYEDIVEEAVLAEHLGYDGIWLGEQNLVTFLCTPDPVQLASVIAARTERIHIGVAIFILPFHHPLRLAGEVAQIDVLSGGRFEVGVGRGASPYQAQQFERVMEDATSRRFFREHLEIMMRYWSDTSHDQAYHGEFYNIPQATVLPQSIQRPHPRVWVATIHPRTTRWAVELGLPNTNHFMSAFREPFSYVEEGYAQFLEGLKATGRDRSSAAFGVNRHTYVAETSEQARQALPWIQRGHRVVAQQVIARQEKIKGGEYDTSQPVPNEPSLDEMFENTLMGDVDSVQKKVAQYHDLGVDMLSAWQEFGMPHEDVKRSMTLFAERIMPKFRSRRSK